ncbi:MAG: phosphatase PAP2 family protein [Bacteroidales bacterium]|nr:phosphatase PAP2 family protein [Bacteroidales bacterium]
MNSFIKRNIVFAICVLLLSFVGMAVILITDKFQLHVILNNQHSVALDVFFKTITFVASRWAITICVLIFLFYNTKYALITAISGIAGSFLVQFLKRAIFAYHRPSYYFDMMPGLNKIENYELYQNFSFPSGHATTAFTLFFVLSMVSGRWWLKMGLFILALVVAYSRVCLSQHFFEDVIAGAALGFVVAYCTAYIFDKSRFNRLELPVYKLFKSKQ